MANVRDINAIESEAGIIATLIHNPDFVFRSEQLKPEYFTDATQRELYNAIETLAHKNITTIDVYNLKEALGAESSITTEAIQEMIDVSDAIARGSLEEYRLLVSNVVSAAFRRDVYIKLKNVKHCV